MDKKEIENQEKRRHFRIEYPASMRPVLKVRKYEFEVLDISEKGIKFLVSEKVKLGRWVNGEITFYNDKPMGIEGKIMWEHEKNIGMMLNIKSIPYSKILSEQRLLARLKPEDDS